MIPLVGGAEGGGVLPPVRAEIAIDSGAAFGLLVPMADQVAEVAIVTVPQTVAPPVVGALPVPEVALVVAFVQPSSQANACEAVESGDGEGGGEEATVSLPDKPELPERGKPRCEERDAAPEVVATAAGPVGTALPLRIVEPMPVEERKGEPLGTCASDGGDWQEAGRVPVPEEGRFGEKPDDPETPVVADAALAEVLSFPSRHGGTAGKAEAVMPDMHHAGSGDPRVSTIRAPQSGRIFAGPVQARAEVGAGQGSVSVETVDPAQAGVRELVGIAREPVKMEDHQADYVRGGSVGAAAGARDVPALDTPRVAASVPEAEKGVLGKGAVPLVQIDRLALTQWGPQADGGEGRRDRDAGGGLVLGDDPSRHEPPERVAGRASNRAPALAAVLQVGGGGADPAMEDQTGFVLPSGDVVTDRRPPVVAAGLPPAHPAAVDRFAALPPAASAALVAQARAGEAGPVTVTLSPDELGTLRFEMHGRGEAIHVALVVERPETLDLLRRHAEQLAGEFRQAGFAGASFSFSGGQAGPGGGAERRGTSAQFWQGVEEEAVTVPKARRAGTGAGLNLLL